jgi:hypothetical protein
VWPIRAGRTDALPHGEAMFVAGGRHFTSCHARATHPDACRRVPCAAHARSRTCQSARLTLRGKNAATKIENNSKIFDALSVSKESDLKIN